LMPSLAHRLRISAPHEPSGTALVEWRPPCSRHSGDADVSLEIHLQSEFHDARVEHRGWTAVIRTVRRRLGQDRRGIQGVVDIEDALEPGPTHFEIPDQSEVELLEALRLVVGGKRNHV